MVEISSATLNELVSDLEKEGPKAEEAIGFLRKDSHLNVLNAAQSCIRNGLVESAIMIYEKTEHFYSAGSVAEDAGLKERAKELYAKAMKLGVLH